MLMGYYISKLSGVKDSVLIDNRIVMSKVYEIMIANESHDKWEEQVLEFTSAYYSEKGTGNYSEEEIEQSKKNLVGSIPEDSYDWILQLY